MDKYQLLKKIVPGLFPLLVFIIIDEIYGTSAGLIAAVAMGIIQLIFIYVKEKVFDKFTLLDTLLIIILGGISFWMDNAVFFKLKPAMIGIILCTLFGLSAFSRMNLFAFMSKKYLGDINLNEQQLKQFNRNTKALFYLFSFHTLLVIYSAFFMSQEAWAFISTILFYFLFGIYIVYELLRIRFYNFRHRNEEWLPLVDENGKITGKAPRSLVHKDKTLLHPVVHLHLINKNRQIFLQKRSLNKLVQPGKWDTAVGGHVSINEDIETALKRETAEETGITNFDAVPVCRYIWKSGIESELVFLFYAKHNGAIRLNPEEADEGKFWKVSEIKKHAAEGIFTPNFELELDILRKNLII